MRVGIDIDGTITVAPEFFAFLSQVLREAGHEVHIMTFRDKKKYGFATRKDLQLWGVVYDELHMGEHVVDPALKAKWAEELDLDFFFEDNIDVLAAMPEKVRRFLVLPFGEIKKEDFSDIEPAKYEPKE